MAPIITLATFDAQAIAAARRPWPRSAPDHRLAHGERQLRIARDAGTGAGGNSRSPSAIVFSTGYTANLGVIGTLAGPGAVVLIDAGQPRSIYGRPRRGAERLFASATNDAADLSAAWCARASVRAKTIIIVEGIYSMLGDVAPLVEIVDIKRRLGGYLLVDEALLRRDGRARPRAWPKRWASSKTWISSWATFSKAWLRSAVSPSAARGWTCCATAAGRISLPRRRRLPASRVGAHGAAKIAPSRAAGKTVEQCAPPVPRHSPRLGYTLGPRISPVVPVMIGSGRRAAFLA